MLTKDPIDVHEKLQNPPTWKPCDTCMKVKSKLKNRKPVSLEAIPGKPFIYFLTQNQRYDLNGTLKRRRDDFPPFII